MTNKYKQWIMLMLISMIVTDVLAYDIAVENENGVTIYYNYTNEGKDLEVTSGGDYSGNLIIPEDVFYMNRTRKVTRIDQKAFMNCRNLISVTIPCTITEMGEDAFYGCSNLSAVHISDIASWCNVKFNYSHSNPLTYAKHLLCNDVEIIDLIIPDRVTSISGYAFYGCSNLTSVTIPSSVTQIGASVFSGCVNLASVIIGDNVSTIGESAFSNCQGLTNVVIPNNVERIGARAFESCSGLKTITFPKSVTYIGYFAFIGVELHTIVSLIENPFGIVGKSSSTMSTFSLDTYNNATLYVPNGTIDKYKTTEGWKDFLFIEEGTGPNGGEIPESQKCAKPSISYKNGKLTFNCDTEGAICQSTITDSDITSYNSNEVQLGVTYRISVYATKAGYDNSETVTATLCWIDVEPKTEGIVDNYIASVRAQAVLIQSNGSALDISGADAGTTINVYDTAGRLVGSAKASVGTTTISTTLQSGKIGIVKIGEKSIKVAVTEP